MQYLREEQYYIDLYDLLTVKRCLDCRKAAIKVPPQKPKGVRVKVKSLAGDLFTYFIKGEEFQKKSETINEWMRRDKEKDNKVNSAIPPKNISCDYCFSSMNFVLKDFNPDDTKVMFWFECPSCHKRKAILDNGERYKPKPNLCPRCSSEVRETFKRKGGILTTFTVCPNCKYKTTEITDFEKDKKKWEEKQRQDAKLLKKYRWQFCMSEKQGEEYIQFVSKMKLLTDHFKEKEQKEADPAYQKAKKLKRLKIIQLKELLNKIIGKEGYRDLQFGKPEMGQYVIIDFTANDAIDGRVEYDSVNQLKRLFKKALADTNWRLMSEGISYRLGILSGRLKAYEKEDDLMRLVKMDI